jgi:hypothetical protein
MGAARILSGGQKIWESRKLRPVFRRKLLNIFVFRTEESF